MTQTDISLTPPSPVPALPSERVERMARLTRDYARLSRSQAGLPALLGGGFLLLVALVEATGHHWHFTWMGAFSPLPFAALLVVAPLPLLWLLARAGVQSWTSGRFGRVEALAEPLTPAQARKQKRLGILGRFVLPGIMLIALVPLFSQPMPARFLRALFLVGLAALLHVVFPRLQGRVERVVGLLLFFAPTFSLAGLQMAAGDTFLAYPLIGTLALILGLRDHLAFRRVRRELECSGAAA